MWVDKIKILAKKRGIIIKDLAIKIDMSEANLYKVFKRQSIETRDLEKIASVLGVPVSYFFDDKEAEEAKKIIQAGNHNQALSNNNNSNTNASKELELCKKELDYLKKQVQDKEEIIELLKSKTK